MKSRLGDDFDEFEAAHLQAAPVSIRLNPQKWQEKSILLERIPWTDKGYYLPERPLFTADPYWHGGAYYVQEASSMLLEQVFKQLPSLQRPILALDLCAAPGGKSTHLLSLLHEDSVLVSNELISNRFQSLQENLIKWGSANVVCSNLDPKVIGDSGLQFDFILVDAPCSGEGLFRKSPDACKEWSLKNVENCSIRQQNILQSAIAALKPGGILCYSTCTYEPLENQVPLERWIAKGTLKSLSLDLDDAWGFQTVESSTIVGYQAYPHRVRGEGFYLSVFEKLSQIPPTGSGRVANAPTMITPKQKEALKDWVNTEIEYVAIQDHLGQIRLIQAAHWQSIQYILSGIKIKSAGIIAGQMKGDAFVPDHALAMSLIASPQIARYPLDLNEALQYLKKETIASRSEGLGWALANYKGFDLGWLKRIPGRINNLYPSEWRIRLSIPSESTGLQSLGSLRSLQVP